MNSLELRIIITIVLFATFFGYGCMSSQKRKPIDRDSKRYQYDIIGTIESGDIVTENLVRQDLEQADIEVGFIGRWHNGIYVRGGNGVEAWEILSRDKRLKHRRITLFKEILHKGELE